MGTIATIFGKKFDPMMRSLQLCPSNQVGAQNFLMRPTKALFICRKFIPECLWSEISKHWSKIHTEYLIIKIIS